MKETAAILLYNSEKKILLIQRTYDAPRNPGRWSFFGGHIKLGENPHSAVIREAKEELGVNLDNPQLLITSNYKDIKIYVFIHPFTKMRIKQMEGRAHGWYSLEEALKLRASPEVTTSLKRIALIWHKVGHQKN